MIPVLVEAGHRCIAPDLVGFGRTDKPRAATDYTYARHVEWLRAALFDQLDLSGITLVCQDWGGLLGLRLVGEHPDRFARVVAANTFLPDRRSSAGRRRSSAWQQFSQEVETFPIGIIVNGGCTTDAVTRGDRRLRRAVPRRVLQGGRPPVPAARADLARRSRRRRPTGRVGGARAVRQAVPRARSATATRSPPGPTGCCSRRIPGAAGQPHTTIEGGGHFLQEDRGPELAAVVAAFIAST